MRLASVLQQLHLLAPAELRSNLPRALSQGASITERSTRPLATDRYELAPDPLAEDRGLIAMWRFAEP